MIYSFKLLSVSKEFKINTYDIDVAGHLNNIAYIRWLEELRNELFEKIFRYESLIADGFYPVVINTSIIYKKQIKLFDNPKGIINLKDFNHNIFFLDMNFLVNDLTYSTANQRCIIIELNTSKMITKENLKNYIKE